MKNKNSIGATLTEDQYSMVRRKLFVEGLSWQKVISALINAYIMGDISVTTSGRYKLSPPSGYIPVIRIPDGVDEVEIEPDWGVNNPRPQMGSTSDHAWDEEIWKTRELVQYVREITGRRISIILLRELLNHLDIPKANTQWKFTGPEDKYVTQVIEAIEEGLYDELSKLGTGRAEQHRLRNKRKLDEPKEAKELTDKEKRIQHLRKLRQIEETE